MRRFALAFGIAAIISGVANVGPARAQVIFDLANDWSDTSNPNGVWQYRGGSTAISTHQASWSPGAFAVPQPAWADGATESGPGSGFIPAWFRSVTDTLVGDNTYDVPVGRVATHTTDPFNGNDAALSNILWTSPVAGIATISGDTWEARKSLGRSNSWTISHDGTVITGGSVTSTDAFTSSSPFLFQNGSGGAGVLTFPVAVGDTVMFEAVRISASGGDFVGVDLSISVAVPEPSTLLLVGLSSAGQVRLIGSDERLTVPLETTGRPFSRPGVSAPFSILLGGGLAMSHRQSNPAPPHLSRRLLALSRCFEFKSSCGLRLSSG